MTNAALIIVDVQNDFCPGGPLAVPEGEAVVPVINRLIPAFKIVVTTQDWHPADHVSFATEPQFIDKSWPAHCVADTPGAALRADLQLPAAALAVRKGTDAAVEAYSGFQDTGLATELKTRGIRKVYVCGLATDYCVKATALDAVKHGLKTYVVLDACRGVNIPAGAAEAAVAEMRAAGVSMVQAAEVV